MRSRRIAGQGLGPSNGPAIAAAGRSVLEGSRSGRSRSDRTPARAGDGSPAPPAGRRRAAAPRRAGGRGGLAGDDRASGGIGDRGRRAAPEHAAALAGCPASPQRHGEPAREATRADALRSRVPPYVATGPSRFRTCRRAHTRAPASYTRSGAAGPRPRPAAASGPRCTTGRSPRTTACRDLGQQRCSDEQEPPQVLPSPCAARRNMGRRRADHPRAVTRRGRGRPSWRRPNLRRRRTIGGCGLKGSVHHLVGS